MKMFEFRLTIVNIGSGNGLLSSGHKALPESNDNNKTLPEAMLTQIYVVIWRH